MTLSRRRLMAHTGRLAAASAFLPLMSARAAPATPFVPPRNLLVIYHPNGLEPGWKPTMANGELVLSPVLQALAPFRKRALVVYGLEAGIRNEIMAHPEGMTSMWTGAQIAKDDAYSSSPSVDQLIAARASVGRPVPSLELGVQSQVGFGAGDNGSVMIYSRSGKLQPEDDPNAVFRRLFSTSTTPQERAQAAAERSSVLDFIRGDLSRVRSVAGLEAASKLDAHLEGVRQLEVRLQALASLQCNAAYTPHSLSASQLGANEQFVTLAGLQSELAVLALSCDVTRVVSVQLSNSVSDRRIPGVNPSLGIHGVMHAGSRTEKVAINQFFVGQVASLLGRLNAVQRADGSTLLDETLVVWGTEMAVGNHLRNPVPFFVFGGDASQGYFRQNTLLEPPAGQRTTQLLISVMRAFGLNDVSTLGDLTDEAGRGPLAGAARSA